MNRNQIPFVLASSILLAGCTTAPDRGSLVCSSTNLRFEESAEIEFWLVSDGLYIAKAALAECPLVYMDVAGANGGAAFQELAADIRNELLLLPNSPGVGTYWVQAQGYVDPSGPRDLPTIMVQSVASFRQSPLPEDVYSNLRPGGR